MQPDVVAVRGDGIGNAFFRGGSGTARITILADCRTSQSSEVIKPSLTITISRTLNSVTVELAGQKVAATRTADRQGIATFGASIDVSGVEGALAGQVVVRGKQTQTTEFNGPGRPTTETSDWTTPKPFVAMVIADTTAPTIELISLDDQTNTEASQTMRLAVTETGSGLQSATWEIVDSGGGNLVADGGSYRARVDWRIATSNPRDVPAPVEVPVVIRAWDSAQPNGNESTFSHTLRDAVAPTLQVDAPAPNAELPNDGTGATVLVSGFVADHWSGVALLTLTLDDAPAIDLWLGRPPATEAAWSHTLRIPDFGHHRVAVHARDAAGNSVEITRDFEIAAPLAVVAERDPFGPGSYLADLVDFAGRVLAIPGNAAASLTESARRRRAAVEVGRMFYQPILRVTGAADTGSGAARNDVRSAIEIFQRVLDPMSTDLVAHWPLTDGAGPTAVDATSNGFSGRARTGSSPEWVVGRRDGLALRFDGINDELVVNEPGALTMRDAVSVAAWVRADGSGTGDFAIILNKENEYELGRAPDTDELAVAIRSDTPGWTWIRTGIGLPVGEWVHVALVYDGGAILCYRNGRLAYRQGASGLLGTSSPNLQDVRIGGRQVGVARFEGVLSDIRLYRGAPSAATIARLAEREPVLWARWMLDRESGTVDSDVVAGREITVVGATWGLGRTGRALVLGSGDHARVDDMTSLHLGADDEDFALAVWVRPDEPAAARRTILALGAEADRTVEVFLAPRANAVLVRVRTGPGTMDGPAEPVLLPVGRWVHVTCVKDGDRLVIYVDGVVRERHRLAAAVAGTEGPLDIGTSADDGFTGAISDLRVYGSSLTGPEVAAVVTEPEVGRRAYLDAAYRTLLQLNGTSFDELRLMRGADRATRERLAGRLGIALRLGSPDEIDDLLRPTGSVTEQWLEEMFGLVDSTRRPLTTPPPARLLGWRRAAVRALWQEQDRTDLDGTPIVDPAFVTFEDLVDPVMEGSLIDDRAAELATRRADLAAARALAATPAAAFAATVELGLAPVSALLDLRERRAAGAAVRSDLAALSLDPREFDRVLGLYELAERASIEPSEWRELDDVLVEVFRRRRFVAWRTEELTYLGGRPLVLSPDHFRLRSPSDGAVAAEARLRWEDRLVSRIKQDASVLAAHSATLADAEAIVLPILRGALAPAAACVLGVQGSDDLSQRLLLDATAGSSVTTPARQAAELVGGVLFGIRTGRIDDTHPAGAWSIPDLAAFDADWPWMSAIETWQAAIAAFFYVENLLNPALRGPAALGGSSGRTAFGVLVDGLRRRDGTMAQRVANALAAYTAERAADSAIPDVSAGVRYVPDPARADRHRELNDAVAGGALSLVAQEVLYFVPLTIALQLHRWGAHAAALDWFRLVYDDGAAGARRAVYAGLRAERNEPRQRSRLDDWLRDLNPHSLATSQGGNPYTRFTVMALARCLLDFGDAEFTWDTTESRSRARLLYLAARELVSDADLRDVPGSDVLVLPPNPALELLTLRVDNQLRKLREGRNIAGMKRPVEPELQATGGVPAGPAVGADGRIQLPSRQALRPTGHRYAVLVERARRLVALSAQVEAAYLQALERHDTEIYRELEAGHHLELAARGSELQRLRVTQARNGTELARRRQSRVRVLQRTYSEWLDEGLNGWEEATIAATIGGGVARATAIGFQAGAAIAQAAMSTAAAGPYSAAVAPAAAAFGTLTVLGTIASGAAITAETTAQISSFQASFERRRDEWELQQGLANQDIVISDQEILVATDQEQINSAEAATAQLQQTQAKAVADYLATRFLNAELYQWMSGVLADVYAHLLQQATATAQLAQQQLAFERQLPPVGFVKDDYWAAVSDDGAATRDRRGLTGSTRLLQDLEELDQYALENDERKLNLSQTFSLANLAPFEFQQFRNTGVLPFSTPMSLFDRDFPGHYLRLIKRVRVSLLALLPPVRGIRATLATTGVSRVIVGGDSFREVVIRRDPEQIALTSPTGATGVFELDAQADLLAPFEAMGVHTSWEFQLPHAANPFSFDDIADVLVTIDYTALSDDDYRQQVIASFDRRIRADLAVSLRNDRPDTWYELHNPSEGKRPFAVQFDIARSELPPNIHDVEVAHVLLAVIRTDGIAEPIEVDLRLRPEIDLRLEPDGTANGPFGGTATSTPDGIISTRRAVGTPWLPIQGRKPVGTWELAFTGAIAPLVAVGAIQDVLMVMSFSGVTPPWPT